jgi:mitochondrial fission protein ELM1
MAIRDKRILILSDGKAGHESQARALCAGLGVACEVVRVAYPFRLGKAASYLYDRLGIRTSCCFDVAPFEGPFDAIVGAGSTTFYPLKVLARRLQIPSVALLYPRGYRLDFDCIVAPTFDQPPELPQVVTIPANLTNTNDAFYAQGVAEFRQRHTPARPAVGLILGGPNPFAHMEADEMAHHFDRIFAATAGMERWITTSRRTPRAVEALVDRLPFDYKLIYSRDTFNPIPAFVMLCETLFVSNDSTGMISEAVTRGRARVEVIPNLRNPHSKFGRFVDDLARDGHAHLFQGTLGEARRKIDLAPALARVAERLRW